MFCCKIILETAYNVMNQLIVFFIAFLLLTLKLLKCITFKNKL